MIRLPRVWGLSARGADHFQRGAATMHATFPRNGQATNGELPIPEPRFTLPSPNGANGVVPHAAPPSANGDDDEQTARPPSSNGGNGGASKCREPVAPAATAECNAAGPRPGRRQRAHNKVLDGINKKQLFPG